MRRKHRVFYEVSNTSIRTHVHWQGCWTKHPEPGKSCGSHKRFRTLEKALNAADKINSLGGLAIIEKWFWVNGERRWRLLSIPGFKPWSHNDTH